MESYEQYAWVWIARWPRLSDVTSANIDAWMRERLAEVQVRTIRKWLTALRGLLAWCVEHDLMSEAPTVPRLPRRAVGTVARPRRHHPDLPADVVERVLARLPVLSERETVHGTRCPIRAWYTVLWETGLRPATLLELEAPAHYRRGAEELVLSAGTDKARYARRLPLTDAARAALDAVAPDVGRLFPRQPGRGHLRAAAEAAGLGKADVAALTPYSLRHARIVHLIESGANLIGVQYLAGHKHVSTTANYVRAAHRHAVDALRSTRAGAAPPKPKAKGAKRGES